MRTVLQLIKKDYRLFFHDRRAVSMTFIVPIVLIIVWGAVFSRVDSGPEKLHLAFINNSSAPVAKQIEATLDTMHAFSLIRTYQDDQGNSIPFDTNSIKEYVLKGNASAALVLPVDMFTDTSSGVKLKFYYDPKNTMEIQVIDGLIQQTVYRQMPDIFQQITQQSARSYLGAAKGKIFTHSIDSIVQKYFGVQHFTSRWDTLLATQDTTRAGTEQNKFFENIIRLEREQVAGKEIVNPWATRSVGGWAIMFLLFTLTASASSLFEEKRSGVVLRLLASPVSRVQILWSKYIYNMSLGIIQLMVLFSFGSILYKIDVFSHLFNLIVLVIAAATACAAFGMLLAAVSKTAAQANGLGTLLILTMSSVGGAWFPTSFMPSYVQTFSKLTLVYWTMDGFLKVLWSGATFIELLPNLGILFSIAFLITLVSAWQFKKGHVF
ncbi:MAG: ABC transporter permease [Bacteroidota bacterium]